MSEDTRRNGKRPGASLQAAVPPLVKALSPDRKDVAAELSLTYATLYAWSVGRRRPSPKNARRLAELAERRARRLSELAEGLRAAIADRTGRVPRR